VVWLLDLLGLLLPMLVTAAPLEPSQFLAQALGFNMRNMVRYDSMGLLWNYSYSSYLLWAVSLGVVPGIMRGVYSWVLGAAGQHYARQQEGRVPQSMLDEAVLPYTLCLEREAGEWLALLTLAFSLAAAYPALLVLVLTVLCCRYWLAKCTALRLSKRI
jgi:hypothetical protein